MNTAEKAKNLTDRWLLSNTSSFKRRSPDNQFLIYTEPAAASESFLLLLRHKELNIYTDIHGSLLSLPVLGNGIRDPGGVHPVEPETRIFILPFITGYLDELNVTFMKLSEVYRDLW